MSTVKITATVIHQEPIGTGIYSMQLQADAIAKQAQAGQFVNLYSKDGSRLLPRPISLCEIDAQAGTLRLVYRTAGKGTEEFSHLRADDRIDIMGPLGNGFTKKPGTAVLMGGGIGIPPMLQLAKELSAMGATVQAVLGYRDETFLDDAFAPYTDVFYASEDGTHGVKGNVMDALREYGITGDTIYACGPTPMLRAIQSYALEQGIEAQLSLEEKMACGIGACLACVCKSKEKDHHTNVHNKRICKDGPVFLAGEVEF